MGFVKSFDDSPTAETIKDVCDIVSPLNQLDITYFNFVRVYNDGSRVSLANDYEWAKYFFDNLYYEDVLNWMEEELIIQEKSGLSLTLWDPYSESELIQAANSFNITNGITLTKIGVDYTDYYHFASKPESDDIIKFYINNIDFLLKYSLYFRDKGEKLIETSSNFRWGKPGIRGNSDGKNDLDAHGLFDHRSELKNSIIDGLAIDRYYLEGKFGGQYLTKREVICTEWLAKGKSAEEVGLILGISNRTVEKHLDSVKKKLGCYKITSILSILKEYGIL